MRTQPFVYRRRFHRSLGLLGGTVLLLGLIFWGTSPRKVLGWGAHGHEISGRAAARTLPASMPSFFRRASDQLAYLNPEPDRWRDRAESSIDRAMDAAAGPDHFIDLELVPAAARGAVHRYDFATELIKAGQKPTTTGLSPYRMLELFQRLRIQFRLWRQEKDSRKRGWIEDRILNEAGILGHYVTDAANPHHTTIHYNGWSGPNPQGYTTYTRERGFHFRFEEEFVGAQVRMEDLLPRISSTPRIITQPREAIWSFVEASNTLVEPLYKLDKQEPFSATTKSREHKEFAVDRLAAGATFLRDLWWTAWTTSETPPPAPRATR